MVFDALSGIEIRPSQIAIRFGRLVQAIEHVDASFVVIELAVH
jgi:hypothetical protein